MDQMEQTVKNILGVKYRRRQKNETEWKEFFGIIGIKSGLYSLYAWFQLNPKGIIPIHQFLVPKDTKYKEA